MAVHYSETPENLRFLASRLRAGEPVAVPTETVYGLAADARNEAACRNIFRIKERPSEDPLIVHLPESFDLFEIARPSPLLDPLRRAFWPGPLTVVMEKNPAISDIVTAGLSSVAIRVPSHPVFRKLLDAFGGPLAAPSANLFGYVSPTTAEHVEAGLGNRIACILDGGPCRFGIESSIVDIRDPGRPVLLRPGAIPRDALEAVLKYSLAEPSGQNESAHAAPGRMPQHYSPATQMQLVESPLLLTAGQTDPRTAYLFFQKPEAVVPGENIFWLSESGSLEEAAARLYDRLRHIDARGYALLVAETVPDRGLGQAINDRLRRAAAKK